ncbi:ACP S-malonyltransferase [Stigmatella sp. ncwal1]|uniref:Malonyl CoA-acyl carrier protein transacylase n=1 Tax=Stigmatella ashevillensis TaxID=2995309 RepID=A0ABT5D4F4_9BACT|nr:ACP S-malonyltransferase [Stigmatella ashevillena]MDC0708548.1 ACP S-malonyltransferase [Stigmatella ashevillena]
MTNIYVFPGQGSQTIGMGKELFPRYKHLLRQADALLGYSVAELCLSGPQERLSDTRYTQPALYVVNALSYLEEVRRTGVLPDFVAGHSLGEYNALFASGAFDFLTGLELVQRRGALMAAATGGGMAAVLGLPPERLSAILDQQGLTSLDVANLNSPQQIVISGPKQDIQAAKPILEREGANTVVPLKVSAAFHSRYMRSAAEQFSSFLSGYQFAELKIPVISNTEAAPYEDGRIAETLTKQLAHPVRWMDTVAFLLQQPAPEILEIGPGQVLTRLTRQIAQHPLRAAS